MGQALSLPKGFEIVNQPQQAPQPQGLSIPEGFEVVQPEAPRTTAGEIARPALRAIKSSVVGSLGSAGDLAQEAANFPSYLGRTGARAIEKAIYGDNIIAPYDTSNINTASPALRQGIDSLTGGLTKPRNKTEENLQIAEEIVGGIGGPAAASKVAQGAKNLATNGIRTGIQKLVGVDQKAVQAFADAGIDPRLADISTSKPTKAFQNLLEVFPGSASTIQKATQNQVNSIAKSVAGIAGSEGGTISQAGTKIKAGSKNFITAVNNKAEKNFINLGEKVGRDTQIPLNNTLKLLNEPEIQDVISIGSGDTARVASRISELANGATYNRARILRSAIGKKTQSASLGEDDRGAIKRIYGALTEDMKVLAQNKGPDALSSFNKANNFYKTTTKYIDNNIQPLIKAKTPEKVYQLAFSGSNQGGTNLNRILRVLKPEQKDFVVGSVAKEMGTQKAALQNAEGDIFSPNKFLTEYNKLQKVGTDKYIFNSSQREAYGNLNKAISNIKETSQIAQKSNNLPYMNWLGLIGGVAASPITAGQAAGAVTGARITAEMMTNPKFINWLTKASKVTPKEIPNHLKALSVIASQNSALREDVLDYLNSITTDKEKN